MLRLRDVLRRFADEREWDQFHSPKNLAIALSVEAAELLEQFQWISDQASRAPEPPASVRIRHELADVFICLIRIADQLDIDLIEAAQDKIALNEERYPVDKARGNCRKHSDL